MKIYIKNMVCIRCKMVVKDEFARLGIDYTKIELGEANVITPITTELHDYLKQGLAKSGLELMDDKKAYSSNV